MDQEWYETVGRHEEWATRPAHDGRNMEKAMGFIVKQSSSREYKRVPPGVYVARCYALIDLGTQTDNGKFGEKRQHKIRIQWELFGEDEDGNPLTIEVDGEEKPMIVSKNYAMSLHEKARLRLDLASWRGKDFTEDEARNFDVSKLLNAYCMLNITERTDGDKTYTNVSSISPLPAALKNAKPEPINETIVFDLDQPNWSVYEKLPAFLQELIAQSPQYAEAKSAAAEF